MKTYICEICGDAYIGEEAPANCPFCGASKTFIKKGDEAKPVFKQDFNLSEVDKKNLQTTLDLELNAVAIYLCMKDKSDKYEIRAMYKRLAKVEKEHASIAKKFLGLGEAEVPERECSDDEVENFKKTIALEDNATKLYKKFAQESNDVFVKKFFNALAMVEQEHIDLIQNYV